MAAEVTEVVRLILEHARTRPGESLGVIALGVKHAERVDVALRAALRRGRGRRPSRPPPGPRTARRGHGGQGRGQGPGAVFAEDVAEPFFVKNLERVQGDERDAIIISVGYGKHPDGRMRYQWGPLLRDGGERRLNVAATRARRRLTVVSSFSSHDVDPSRLTAPGARLLAEYLEYARAGGVHVAPVPAPRRAPASPRATAPPATARTALATAGAFHADVAARLAELGITVVPQYGVGGYRVDFAAAHPDDPARMILAIEADGAGYRDSGSVRDRDRLRKEHLERLGWHVHRLWSTAWFTDPGGRTGQAPRCLRHRGRRRATATATARARGRADGRGRRQGRPGRASRAQREARSSGPASAGRPRTWARAATRGGRGARGTGRRPAPKRFPSAQGSARG